MKLGELKSPSNKTLEQFVFLKVSENFYDSCGNTKENVYKYMQIFLFDRNSACNNFNQNVHPKLN